MRSRNSLARTVSAWLLLGAVLAAAFLGFTFREPLLGAAGLIRSGAPSTIEPSFFAPDPAPSLDPAGIGLIEAVRPPAEGALPERSALEAKLAALDTAQLLDQAQQPVQPGYAVVDLASGEVVAARNEAAALIPASNTKLLTVVALLNRFTGEETFATTVVQPEPGTIVLTGGGDPMLAAEPVAEGSYPRPASTRELATATAEALKKAGRTSVTLGYDATYFADPGWATTWPARYGSQVTRISALWVDEGIVAAARSADPALAAATTFAAQLTQAGIAVTAAPAPAVASGEELARVESLPVHVLAEIAMQRSNNSYTEVLGFQLAKAAGQPTTFAGAVAAVQAELVELGIWSEGATLVDASGLSRENLVSAAMLASAVRAMATQPKLNVILDGLPIAGVTGTLADRFSDPISQPARGVVRAKTGSLNFVATLAGTTRTSDGRQLAFAFLVNGPTNGWAAKVWTDQAAGVVTSCGCS